MMKSYDVDCYFPMKTGCHVTLYQDAHVLPNHLSSIPFGSMERPDGLVHQPRYVLIYLRANRQFHEFFFVYLKVLFCSFHFVFGKNFVKSIEQFHEIKLNFFFFSI